MALSATVDGQTTAHYVADTLSKHSVEVSRLGHGVPVGGELDYMDEGTIAAALSARKRFSFIVFSQFFYSILTLYLS